MQNSNSKKGGQFQSLSLCRYPKWVHRMIRAVVVMFVFIFSQEANAQISGGYETTYPTVLSTSCTSKDLELLSATLEGTNGCVVDAGPKRLILKINNKTGSTRTSFAFWGNLYVDGEIQDTVAFACAGPIPGGSIVELPTNTYIDYSPGSSYVVKDLFLAWTTANKKDDCAFLAANPNAISPKCGTLDSIVIPSGVGATVTPTQADCVSGKGSIRVSPKGGVGPYKVALYKNGNKEDSVAVSAGASKDFSTSAGDYTIYVYDARPCKIEYNTTVDAPDELGAPESSVTDPDCITRTGVVSITNYNASYTYYLIKDDDTTFFVSSTKSGVVSGTYHFEVVQGVCKTAGDDVTIDPAPPIPSAPTGCITQPTLCGLTKATVSIQSPTSGDGSPFTYSIDSSTWETSNQFTNLNAGSSPRFWVKNSYGCISIGASACGFSNGCSTIVEDKVIPDIKNEEVVSAKRPAPATNSLGSGTLESGVTIKAVPNPFGNKVRFMITTEEAGNGVLEIYNIQGQKLKTVFQGYVPAGINFYDLTVPAQRRAELIYVFRKGTEQFSGKLLQLDKE